MEVKDIMTRGAVSVSPGESVEVAARTMLRCNVGALPVCNGGRLCGLITDRDIVTRCLAAGKVAGVTTVQQVMTEQVTAAAGGGERPALRHGEPGRSGPSGGDGTGCGGCFNGCQRQLIRSIKKLKNLKKGIDK